METDTPDDVTDRPAMSEPIVGSSWPLTLAGLSAAAGLIHVAMIPVHAGSGLTDPLLFALAGWLQLWAAVALTRANPSRSALLAAAAANLAVLIGWVWSRTAGLPIGRHAGERASIELVDGVAASLAGLAILGALTLVITQHVTVDRPVGPSKRNRPTPARLTPALAGMAALGLATVVIVSPETATHSHGATGGHGATGQHGHDNAAHLADMAAIDQSRCDLGFNPVSYWNEAHVLGVDTYTGGAMTTHDHADPASESLLATAARPDPFGGRGSATLDRLIATTDRAGQGEVAAAQLVNQLSEADDTEYDAWLGWLAQNHSTGHSHAAGTGDDTGGHGGHVGPQPWKAMIDPAQCDRLGDELELARATAFKYPTVADAEAAGWSKVTSYVSGIAAHYMNYSILDDTFQIDQPEMLLYDGNAPDSKIVGLSYYLLHDGTSEPTQGFTGGNDHFHRHIGLCMQDDVVIGDSTLTAEQCAARGGYKSGGDSGWMSHAWVVPGCESPWGVFSAASPILDRTLTAASGTKDGACSASGARDRYNLDAATRATAPTSTPSPEQASGD